MTNPNNAIGTNGAFGGRTSVNAFNDGVASYSKGILSGWACEPSSGLTVILGGDGNTRDVAIAEDNAGNKTTINNISGSPVSVTIGAAPNTNSRIDSIVAYVNNPPTGTSTATDNYGACGLIVVAGTVSSTPSAPSESAIRAAITADGASGTTAYYVVLANITISSGTTDLTSSNITQSSKAQIGANTIDFTTMKKWVPDYENKGSTNILSQTISVIADGWIDFQEIVRYSTSGDVVLKISVNEELIISITGRKDSEAKFSGLVPVRSGDTVSVLYSSDWGTPKAYFVPGKWA